MGPGWCIETLGTGAWEQVTEPSAAEVLAPFVSQSGLAAGLTGLLETARSTMRAELIGHFEPCMTEIYLHI